MVRVTLCAFLCFVFAVFGQAPGARQDISEYLSSATAIRALNNALIRLRSQHQIALQTAANLSLRFDMAQKLLETQAMSQQEYLTRERDKEAARWNSEVLASRILQGEAALRLQEYKVEVARGDQALDSGRLYALYEAQWSTDCGVFRSERGLAKSELALASFRKEATVKLSRTAAASKEDVLEAELDYENSSTALEQAQRLVEACEKPLPEKAPEFRQ